MSRNGGGLHGCCDASTKVTALTKRSTTYLAARIETRK
jgi:hypothetical protein